MDVGSSFSIYGNLFGWYANNKLINFFEDTGIWMIPFIIIIFHSVLSNREKGFDFNTKRILVGLEYRIYVALFIIALFLNPSVAVEKSHFQYNNGVTTETGDGATDTTFSVLSSSLPSEVKLPPVWFAVTILSNGFNSVIKSILPNGATVRQLMHQVDQLEIDDEEAALEYKEFEKNCADPARANYAQLMANHPNSLLAKKIKKDHIDAFKAGGRKPEDVWKVEASYAGSEILTTYFYGENSTYEFCGLADPAGASSLCLPGGEGAKSLSPQEYLDNGTTCREWWDGTGIVFTTGSIRGKLVASAKVSGTFDWIQGKTGFTDDAQLWGIIGKDTNLGRGGGINTKKGDGEQAFFTAIADAFAYIAALIVSVTSQITRFIMPVLLGVVTLFFLMLMPIFILIGRYDLSNAISLLVSISGLFMLPGIWHIIGWMDDVLLRLVWNNPVFWTTEPQLGMTAWSIVVLTSYGVFTSYWLSTVSSLSGGVSDLVSQGMSSGMNNASQNAGSGASAVAGKVASAKGASDNSGDKRTVILKLD